MCDATAIAARKPTNIAAPPSVGVGFVCTWRASDDGATTAPKRIASQRTIGVSSERRAERDRADDRVALHGRPLTASRWHVSPRGTA